MDEKEKVINNEETPAQAAEQTPEKYDFNSHARKSLGEFETDEEYGSAFDTMRKEHGEYKQKADDYELNSKQLAAIITANPEIGDLLQAVFDGDPLAVAILKAGVTPDDLEMAEGEDGYDKFKAVHDERTAKSEARKARNAELEENQKGFAQDYEAFAKETFGDDKETASAFDDFADNLIAKILNGGARKPELVRLHQAFTYKEDVAEAAETGKIAGKNETIVEKRKADSAKISDGMPEIQSGEVKTTKPEPRKRDIIPDPIQNKRV